MSRFELPTELRFRAYGYPNSFKEGGAEQMANDLYAMGVRNIFLGVETFDQTVSQRVNKDWFSYKDVANSFELLQNAGVDFVLPLMPGLPGETKESMRLNLTNLELILKRFGSKTYGDGGLTRVDISPAMPLVGTPWYKELVRNRSVCDYYLIRTGKNLNTDLTPDFDVLRDASLEELSEVKPQDVVDFVDNATSLVSKYMRPEMIGAFDFGKDK